MSNKDFKVKNGLQVPSLTTAGIVANDSSGNITSTAVVGIANGGTGQTTADNALNALLPLQTGKENYFLQTNQVTTQWSRAFYQAIKNAGTTVTPRGYLNIVGASFSDDSLNDVTTITLGGGNAETYAMMGVY